jgi:hypothetical protein
LHSSVGSKRETVLQENDGSKIKIRAVKWFACVQISRSIFLPSATLFDQGESISKPTQPSTCRQSSGGAESFAGVGTVRRRRWVGCIGSQRACTRAVKVPDRETPYNDTRRSLKGWRERALLAPAARQTLPEPGLHHPLMSLSLTSCFTIIFTGCFAVAPPPDSC